MRPGPAVREEGFTLVETLITCLVVSIVLAAAFPVLPVFFRESNIVQNTYQSVDQLVLASEVATRYVHEAVANSTTGNPVATANANNVIFYANTGNATGPEQVVMQVATAGTARTLQVNLYPAGSGSCPGINVNGTGCTYSGSTQSFLLINNLTNGTGGSPVFTYTLDGGEVCAGPPPGSPTTTLHAQASAGATSLSVNALTTAVSKGDTIFLGSGTTAQTVTATAAAAASGGVTTIAVTAVPATEPINTSVYDGATTTVPNTIPTTLKTTASSGATSLSVPSLTSAITSGDTIVVGTGTSAQTVTATSGVAATVGSTTIPISPALTTTAPANTEVYDSSCSTTQVSEIEAVALNLQATKNPGGQPTGYQSLAYFLSPNYSASVG